LIKAAAKLDDYRSFLSRHLFSGKSDLVCGLNETLANEIKRTQSEKCMFESYMSFKLRLEEAEVFLRK